MTPPKTPGCNPDAPASFAGPAGSASPVTDKTWELYNLGKCGLHYIAHKMREIETESSRLRQAIESILDENRHLADGENCTLINLKRALTPNVPDERPGKQPQA